MRTFIDIVLNSLWWLITTMTRRKHDKRMSEAFSLRLLPEQRIFLERYADAHKMGLGDAVRMAIDEAMGRAGAIE
jgi:hypothetical protein